MYEFKACSSVSQVIAVHFFIFYKVFKMIENIKIPVFGVFLKRRVFL